jgi:hypothetical protein
VFVTGASRGYGRVLAVEVGKAVATPLAMVLLARNAGDLAATKALVLEVGPCDLSWCAVPGVVCWLLPTGPTLLPTGPTALGGVWQCKRVHGCHPVHQCMLGIAHELGGSFRCPLGSCRVAGVSVCVCVRGASTKCPTSPHATPTTLVCVPTFPITNPVFVTGALATRSLLRSRSC